MKDLLMKLQLTTVSFESCKEANDRRSFVHFHFDSVTYNFSTARKIQMVRLHCL